MKNNYLAKNDVVQTVADIDVNEARLYDQVFKYYRSGNCTAAAAVSKGADSDNSSEISHKGMHLLLQNQQWLGNYESVISVDGRYVGRFRDTAQAPDAMYSIGQCQYKLQQKDITHDTWRKLIHIYPDSEAAKRAAAFIKQHQPRSNDLPATTGRLKHYVLQLHKEKHMIQIGIIMGSDSDQPVMRQTANSLEESGVGYEAHVVSTHRTPDLMFEYAETAHSRGVEAIIAGAGSAAHLPGIVTTKAIVSVLDTPILSKYLRGGSSLLPIVQIPKGAPVTAFVISEASAANAALFAVSMLTNEDVEFAHKLTEFRNRQEQPVLAMELSAE